MQVTYTLRCFKEAFDLFGDLCRNDLQAMPVVFLWEMRNIDDERNILLCFPSLPLIYCRLPVPDHYWKKEVCSEFLQIFLACVSFICIRCAQRIEGNACGKPHMIKTKYKKVLEINSKEARSNHAGHTLYCLSRMCYWIKNNTRPLFKSFSVRLFLCFWKKSLILIKAVYINTKNNYCEIFLYWQCRI